MMAPFEEPRAQPAAAAAAAAAAAPGAPAPTKARRHHRKSRNGCVECKRRHIRCDEGRPTCANCKMAERMCSFPTTPPARAASSAACSTTGTATAPGSVTGGLGLEVPSPHPGVQIPARSSPSRSISSAGSRSLCPDETPRAGLGPQSLPSFNESFAAAAPPPPSGPPPPVGSTFTPQHLMLLHHVETGMREDILGAGQSSTVVDMAIRYAVECPYLIDQLLAFAAMHLAHKRPEHAAAYRHQATELQTRGLAHFTREAEHLSTADAHSAAPRFLFASLLSLHALADTLTYQRADFDVFLDRFIECIQLHRGILYIVRPLYQVLIQTEVEPIIALGRIQRPLDLQRGTEFEPLLSLVEHLPPAKANPCREAVGILQWAFDLSAQLPGRDIPHAVAGFSVMVPPEYVDVLRERCPEALVILAYYAVLLHRTKRYWVCGGNGAFMITAIARHLGPQWADAMRWPLEALERERD